MSITGHASLKEVERYTKAAAQKALAVTAIGRLTNKDSKFPDQIPKCSFVHV